MRLDSDSGPDEVLSATLRVAGELTGESLDRAVGVWTRSPLQELAHLHLLASPAEPVVARLLAADAQLPELEVQGAALADAFLDLTREAA